MTVKYNFYFTADEVKLIYRCLIFTLDSFTSIAPSAVEIDKLLSDHDFADIVCSEAEDGD